MSLQKHVVCANSLKAIKYAIEQEGNRFHYEVSIIVNLGDTVKIIFK